MKDDIPVSLKKQLTLTNAGVKRIRVILEASNMHGILSDDDFRGAMAVLEYRADSRIGRLFYQLAEIRAMFGYLADANNALARVLKRFEDSATEVREHVTLLEAIRTEQLPGDELV